MPAPLREAPLYFAPQSLGRTPRPVSAHCFFSLALLDLPSMQSQATTSKTPNGPRFSGRKDANADHLPALGEQLPNQSGLEQVRLDPQGEASHPLLHPGAVTASRPWSSG